MFQMRNHDNDFNKIYFEGKKNYMCFIFSCLGIFIIPLLVRIKVTLFRYFVCIFLDLINQSINHTWRSRKDNFERGRIIRFLFELGI